MAFRFASVTEEQILSINEVTVPKLQNWQQTVAVFNGKLFNPVWYTYLLILVGPMRTLEAGACVVYTKVIIHLSVGESGGYLPRRFVAW